jgi:hypothetical protein
MTLRRLTTILTVVLGFAPITFGLNFLFNAQGAASGFGIDPWPTGNEAGYYLVKAGRDLALGLNILILLALGQRRATGIVMAIVTLVPILDMIAVFTHGGSAATALGIHGLTAVIVAIVAGLLLRERPLVQVDAAELPKAQALVN